MSNEDNQPVLDERVTLLSSLVSLLHMVHGFLVEHYTVCSRPQCKCHHGEKYGSVMCIVVNEHGKQRQKYIPKALRGLAVQYIDPVQKAFLTTKGTKKHEHFEGKLMSQPDTSSQKFAFCCLWLELR